MQLPTSLGAAEPEDFNVDSLTFSNAIDASPFNNTPINISLPGEEKVISLPKHDQYDQIYSDIEQDERNRRHPSSTRDWLEQRRCQSSSAQTPCPGDGTDDRMSMNRHGRTFPSVKRFASKLARIMPANRSERGGTLRYQTPEGEWKALSASPTTIGSSPSPYNMNRSPLTPSSCYHVRKGSQLQMFNTINEYVVETEQQLSESEKRNDELADTAKSILNFGEKELEKEKRKCKQLEQDSQKLTTLSQKLKAQTEKEREEWIIKERGLKARIQELEQEAAVLREKVIAAKGDDHLGVQGANPLTGVWSDVEGVGKEKGGVKGKGSKRRGRWRRTESSWAFGASESSTGTVIRNQPEAPADKESSGAGMTIKNIHIHHHHYWRMGGRASRSSRGGARKGWGSFSYS